MDSEDDMHDANDDYYSGDDYCSGDTALEYSDEDEGGDDDGDYGFDHIEDSDESNRQPNYIALKAADIRQHQENEITTLSTVLSVSRADASILLRHHRWSVINVHEVWYADEDGVRKAVGLLESPVVQFQNAQELTCGICFESSPLDGISSAACGHPFCDECWRAYMSTSINGGPGCLMLRCPDPSCGAVIRQDMIDRLVSEEDKERYARYLVRSYIEDNPKTKWCPAPGCEYAVEFVVGNENCDVSCLCSHGFCWNCTEEAHRPVDCGTVAKWIMKNNAESENTNWLLANSKPCPKCKRPIEKNHGCMHMTCTYPCKFGFCWLCLGAWSDHGETTGGFYACNRYEAAKQEGVYDEAERRREMAKKSVDRYTHYYERWATNHSSRQKAIADLHQMQTVNLKDLSVKQSQPETKLEFVTKAWLQIVECRRVLKWTYAYGYYLPEPEHAKRQLFEYLQGEAEAGLERLHQCAEKDLQAYLGSEPPPTDFNDFRQKLAGLTSVTRTYFENLVRALENGLSDVDSKATTKIGPAEKAAVWRRNHRTIELRRGSRFWGFGSWGYLLMDSEDDMHDANDAESMDDDYYSGDTAVEYSEDDDDGDDDGDYEFDNDSVDSDDVSASRRQQKNYIALKEVDIRQHQENEITTISTVLSISRVDASILLRHYHWSVSNVHEVWFADEDRVRKAVGLLERPVVRFPNAKELTCGICFESFPLDRISSAACSHPFCNLCWRAYMSTSINGGPGCLMLRCPDPSCGAAIGQDMINLLVSEEDKEKYARYLLRSYIEDNRKTKWCPAPGCEYAVEFVVGSENYDVSCLCSYGFCWNCTEEAHRPVDCGTVAKWIMKNSAESENMNWYSLCVTAY
ncbi:hypothetical protein RHMOL_Rhmol09G0036300 [Rhododendron molle]|uniref:Uncharacterized protein n=1 Tax=Rhododendron molle TaxID=49168 RepID=A0ACC0MAS6_RHOML|nr:hypothetical protein RHMOL_Rhmol09G0036300 [Rhododendron molle]